MQPFGLYIHIPFCSAICHYCDFAKTANFSAKTTRDYFAALEAALAVWLAALPDSVEISSVFFGGGTPGLFVDELAPLMARVVPRLSANAEVTLEANPNDIAPDKLRGWRQLGFNRLSIGVQSFDPRGLSFLTRQHDAAAACLAVERGLAEFPNTNIDLIYGWHGQDLTSWQRDLSILLRTGVPHVSLYTLTYEGNTVLRRRQARGVLTAATDDHLADCYQQATQTLGDAQFVQDEVSNWARPGYSCAHNWLYWQDENFVGIGSGAHGYVANGSAFGVRYAYPRSVASFLRIEHQAGDLAALPQILPVEIPARRVDDWLAEYIGASLRTRLGTNLRRIRAKTGREFNPTPILAEGLRRNVVYQQDENLHLQPAEWFRETAWSVELLRSLTAAK